MAIRSTTNRPNKPRIFIDADVLFAGAASPTDHGASLTLLHLAEITLLDAVTSEQVIIEAERNLAAKLPATLPAFRHLVARSLTIVNNPTRDQLIAFHSLADAKDQPILAAAVLNGCPWLISFNVRHYRPGHPDVMVMKPGDFLQRIRYLLTGL